MTDAIPYRKLDLTIALGEGAFGADGSNTVELTGHRVSADVVKMAMPGFDSAQIRIWGVAASIMNQVSTLGKPPLTGRVNTVSLRAGDDQSGMSLVYTGIIQEAFQDFAGAPEVALNIQSHGATVSLLKPVPPISYPQGTSVAQAMQDVAGRMTPALAFENHGVTAMLPTTYLPGTAADQLRRIVDGAGIQAAVDNGTLVIWPKGGALDGLIPDIGPSSGLVGYPEFSGSGIVRVRSLYMPGLRVNGDINLTTSLKSAAGKYRIQGLTYELDAELPGGRWFATMEAYRPGVLAPSAAQPGAKT